MGSQWRKLLGDARAERGRVALMVAAVTVSLAAVGAVLGTRGILGREMARSYLGTAPAEATLEYEAGVDAPLLAAARSDSAVREVDLREVVLARVRVGDEVRPMLLFVPDDFATLKLNTFTAQSGAWPPSDGTVLLERSALAIAGVLAEGLSVKTPNGPWTRVGVSGVVHDPGLAPAWQERAIYAYATRRTLAKLGESGALHELRVTFRDTPATAADAERAATGLAVRLTAAGFAPHQLQIPPPRQHPHQRQMETILLLLLVFAGLALVLSSVLVATTLSALLARQVREIGVMKTLGARTKQLAVLYGVLVAAVGAISFLLSVPLGMLGARGLSTSVASMLNFTLASIHGPWWVFAVQAAAGLVVPLAVAAFPIARATRISVRAALDSHGAAVRERLASPWLPVAVRDLLRRPARFALTVGLLAIGGSLFMTALAVSDAWEKNLDLMRLTRHYDVEVRFNLPQAASLAEEAAGLDGVTRLEAWGYAPAAFAGTGQVEVVHTYPDRGHGSLSVMGPPPDTTLVSFPLLEGRWLEAPDEGGVVLNHVAKAQAGSPKVGDEVRLSIDGRASTWTLVGVVQEVGSPATAYVTQSAFAQLEHTGGAARLWRVATRATSPEERTRVIRSVEGLLERRGASVAAVVPFSELRTAIGDHIVVLVRALVALAVILAIVGLLGLGSAVGMSVVERSREIAVMKAVGATAAVVRRRFLAEALVTSAVSWVVAMGASLPLTAFVESLIGRLGFLAPLPFTVSAEAMAGWLALLGVATLVATLPPVGRATRMSVREALAET